MTKKLNMKKKNQLNAKNLKFKKYIFKNIFIYT
jgi:hypothetical protein